MYISRTFPTCEYLGALPRSADQRLTRGRDDRAASPHRLWLPSLLYGSYSYLRFLFLFTFLLCTAQPLVGQELPKVEIAPLFTTFGQDVGFFENDYRFALGVGGRFTGRLASWFAAEAEISTFRHMQGLTTGFLGGRFNRVLGDGDSIVFFTAKAGFIRFHEPWNLTRPAYGWAFGGDLFARRRVGLRFDLGGVLVDRQRNELSKYYPFWIQIFKAASLFTVSAPFRF